MRKKLTYNQKTSLGVMTAVLVFACFIAGVVYLVIWCGETTGMQHYCSGHTGFTVRDTHANGPQVSLNFSDPECR